LWDIVDEAMVDATSITLASDVRTSPDALIQLTGNEAIVLDIAGERYFGLNPIGVRLWQLLAECPVLEDAHRQLLDEYDVSAAELERDLVAIVAQLADAGLVSVD
jgi:hypothetical protein